MSEVVQNSFMKKRSEWGAGKDRTKPFGPGREEKQHRKDRGESI
jgi:hypothetical protein